MTCPVGGTYFVSTTTRGSSGGAPAAPVAGVARLAMFSISTSVSVLIVSVRMTRQLIRTRTRVKTPVNKIWTFLVKAFIISSENHRVCTLVGVPGKIFIVQSVVEGRYTTPPK